MLSYGRHIHFFEFYFLTDNLIHMHIHTALSSTIGRFKTSQYHPTSARISWKESERTVSGYSVQVEGPDSTQD